MKKLLWILPLCLLLISCGGEKKFTKEDLSVYDSVTKKTYYIGDTRERIESILGEPEEESRLYGSVYQGLSVCYNTKDEVVAFNISSVKIPQESYGRFSVLNKISLGTPITEATEKCKNRPFTIKKDELNVILDEDFEVTTKEERTGDNWADGLYVIKIWSVEDEDNPKASLICLGTYKAVMHNNYQ
ncbi:MAG: hypothetical protein IJO50_05165 [Clostridia bacterium]|nr:hypothetical protein [Clostridia bacterium]